MARVITLGEIMLRLSPQGYLRFLQADSFGAVFGGGEANVAVSLANFGMDAAFVTRLPEHDIGQAAVNSLRRYGVDTSLIQRGGSRIGVYYMEKGASQRSSKVIYDRAHSAFSEAGEDTFDWENIFAGADWFHFTGITPALGDQAADLCLAACKAAKAAGVTISCDLNYREALWSLEEARPVMDRLVRYVDVFITNVAQASDLFDFKIDDAGRIGVTPSHEACKQAAKELVRRFGCTQVAVTIRTSVSANDNNWSAMLFDGAEYHFAKNYPIHIVDRVGAGDGFAAGLIYALLEGYTSADAIEFSAAASCLKHSVEGDYNIISVDEAAALAGGDSAGRILR